ncbi:MAG TPA: hypothetical protein VGA75_06310, partial [Paracoccaceae bacterium]
RRGLIRERPLSRIARSADMLKDDCFGSEDLLSASLGPTPEGFLPLLKWGNGAPVGMKLGTVM